MSKMNHENPRGYVYDLLDMCWGDSPGNPGWAKQETLLRVFLDLSHKNKPTQTKEDNNIFLNWLVKTGDICHEVSIQILPNYVGASIACFYEDEPDDVCAFSSKYIDTIEKLEKFLKEDFLTWTNNEVKC